MAADQVTGLRSNIPDTMSINVLKETPKDANQDDQVLQALPTGGERNDIKLGLT